MLLEADLKRLQTEAPKALTSREHIVKAKQTMLLALQERGGMEEGGEDWGEGVWIVWVLASKHDDVVMCFGYAPPFARYTK